MHKVRVRFAPSPTGMMHLGNVRAALINFLFAQQKKGTFVLRSEDTDAQRMFDPEAQKILEDLQWLGLSYNEGPHVGGPYAPYYQSQRTDLYEKQRALFEEQKVIYRCFVTYNCSIPNEEQLCCLELLQHLYLSPFLSY